MTSAESKLPASPVRRARVLTGLAHDSAALGCKLEFLDGEPTVYAGFEGLRRDHASAGGRQTKRHGPQNVRVNAFGSEEDAPYL